MSEDSSSDWKVRRKARYANDPVYKAKALQWSRDFKAKRRMERLGLSADQIKRKPAGPTAAWKTVDVEIDGVTVAMFTLGALAKILGKGMSTLRMWEAKGVLPQTPYRSERGDRLYTYEAVNEIRNALVANGRVKLGAPKRLKKPRTVNKTVRNAKGELRTVALYRVLTLAEVLGKTTSQIWAMESTGLIPVSPLRASELQYRLYTPAMITAVKTILERYGFPILRRYGDPTEIRNAILDEWEKLGMRDAVIVEDTDEGKSSNASGGTKGAPRKLFGRVIGDVAREPVGSAVVVPDCSNSDQALQSSGRTRVG